MNIKKQSIKYLSMLSVFVLLLIGNTLLLTNCKNKSYQKTPVSIDSVSLLKTDLAKLQEDIDYKSFEIKVKDDSIYTLNQKITELQTSINKQKQFETGYNSINEQNRKLLEEIHTLRDAINHQNLMIKRLKTKK